MVLYQGTKRLFGRPITKRDYCALRGWDVPANEDPDEAGYLVEYVDGGTPNVDGFAGYVSYSPADVFHRSYRPVEGMTFGAAIEALKSGARVARKGWNGKGMFLYLVPGSTFNVNRPPLLGIYPEGTAINYCPHIDLKGANGDVSTWAPSCSDALAEDWEIVD